MSAEARNWRAREGPSGILTLASPAGDETFIPHYDLERTRELLLEFQELRDERGTPLKEHYHARGYDWFPTMVSMLYWWVFFPAVKYAPLVQEWFEGRARFTWEGRGAFRELLELLSPPAPRRLALRVQYALFRALNRWTARHRRADVLFFQFAHGDFRTREIRQTLDRLGAAYLDVVPATRIGEMLRRFFRGEHCYYYSQPCALDRGNRFQHRYPLEHLPPQKRRLFAAAIRIVETSITSSLLDFDGHLHALRHSSARVFYGLDDINGHLFPVLYACRELGLRTVGHQHGAYVQRHAGYIMEGIDPRSFRWFDRVIVWGDYWKEKMLAMARVYPPDFFVVGASKLATHLAASAPRRQPPFTILVPYEFLANTARVGEYLIRLLDLGYAIVFKPRPDDELSEQLDCYRLSATYRDKLRLAPKLDDALMAGIDIIAGTMTTLIYELLPCGKIVWVFETEYRHLDDLVEEGLAHKVRYDDLATLDASYFTPTTLDRERLSSSLTLEETLRRYVLGETTPAALATHP